MLRNYQITASKDYLTNWISVIIGLFSKRLFHDCFKNPGQYLDSDIGVFELGLEVVYH